jgi:hypothetical protein
MPMRLNPNDGECRSCGGPLETLDTDQVRIKVTCLHCGDIYMVERRTFGTPTRSIRRQLTAQEDT